MKIYRSALLRFAADGSPVYDSDGLLAVAPDAQGQARVVAAGSWQALQAQYNTQAGAEVVH
ncbi:MAG: guanine deaminase, partial [Comamonadaceae bacterium]|nr:guanine deaminase [Comamonadaceae bacterium]